MSVATGSNRPSRRELLLAGVACVPAVIGLVGGLSLARSWRARCYRAAAARVHVAADGTLQLDGAGGVTLATNAAGRFVWELLADRRTGDDLVAALRQYGDLDDGQAARDLERFLSQLLAEGLVRVT